MFKNQMVEDFAEASHGRTVLSQTDGSTRIAYLKRVFAWTIFGLMIAGTTGFVSTWVLETNQWLLGTWPQIIVILGCFGISQYLCAGLVQKPGQKVFGFVLANASMGVALGFVLLMAMYQSQFVYDNPFILIGEALGMTVSVALGIAVYVWMSPSDFRWAHAIVGALSLPMLVFMALSFFLPFTGMFGLILSAVFVAVSVFGLLTTTQQVMRVLGPDQHVEGAYLITMGIIILFWNLLVLLMRLSGGSRD